MGAVGRMGALGLRFGPDSGELGLMLAHIFWQTARARVAQAAGK